jgi:hypothetical protein
MLLVFYAFSLCKNLANDINGHVIVNRHYSVISERFTSLASPLQNCGVSVCNMFHVIQLDIKIWR